MPQPTAPHEFAIGDRVRTRINLASADWAPEQPDLPAGALGTVDYIHRHPVRGTVSGYGVMLDGSVDRLSTWMDPHNIEPATTPAPLADWAAALAEDGLQPYDGVISLDSGGKPFVRLHLAFAEGMDNADREGFLLKLGQVVLKNL